LTTSHRLTDDSGTEINCGQQQAKVEKVEAGGWTRGVEKAVESGIIIRHATPAAGTEKEIAIEIDIVLVATA